MGKRDKPILASSAIEKNKENFLIEEHNVHGVGILHWHDYYEMEIVFQGHGEHNADSKTFEIKRGSVFMLTPHDFHSVSAYKDEVLKIITINFNNRILPESLLHIIDLQASILSYNFEEHEFISFFDKIMNLKKCYETKEAYKDEMAVALLTQIGIEFLKKVQVKEKSSFLTDNKAFIGNVIIYIKQNFKQPLSKQGVAKKFHITANYLGDNFKRATGETYISYLNNIRLLYAVNLLCMSNLNITSICYEAGFNSPSYFIKIFKERFHCTPATYRKYKIF